MTSTSKTLRSIILCSCAIMALSACDTKTEGPFASYQHSSENYQNEYGDDAKQLDANAFASYEHSSENFQDDGQSRHNVAKFDNESGMSSEKPVPSYSIDVEPASNDVAMISNNKAPTPAPEAKFVSEPATMSATAPSPAPTTAPAPAPAPAMIGSDAGVAEPNLPPMVATPVATPVAPALPTSPFANNIVGCPQLEIYPDMNSISFFKGGDKTKLIASASIGDLRGACNVRNNTLELDLKMLVDARMGQHGRYQTDPMAEELQSYPYYVALINKVTAEVEYKKIFASIVRFPAKQMVQSKYEDVFINIPLPTGQTKDGYILNIGFQLTPEQLDHNRGVLSPTAKPAIPTEAVPVATVQTTAPAKPIGEMATMKPMPAQEGNVFVAPETANNIPDTMTEMPVSNTDIPVSIEMDSPTMTTSTARPMENRRFLRGRPRVSVDPLDDAYTGTMVE